jgi:hypothetical protein
MYEIGDDMVVLGSQKDRLALVENVDLLNVAKIGRASIHRSVDVRGRGRAAECLLFVGESAAVVQVGEPGLRGYASGAVHSSFDGDGVDGVPAVRNFPLKVTGNLAAFPKLSDNRLSGAYRPLKDAQRRFAM